jgi:hypothetical protein
MVSSRSHVSGHIFHLLSCSDCRNLRSLANALLLHEQEIFFTLIWFELQIVGGQQVRVQLDHALGFELAAAAAELLGVVGLITHQCVIPQAGHARCSEATVPAIVVLRIAVPSGSLRAEKCI